MVDSLNLPENITWQFVAASEDMMNKNFHSNEFPNPWKSSIAIYAYEHKTENIDEALCHQRIVFFKVSCSITGYQPNIERYYEPEGPLGLNSEFWEKIIEPYFPCRGVFLNVSVFPNPGTDNLEDFPIIMDFEPKKRELLQTSTEDNQILTSSHSGIKTDKSFSNTFTSETGISAGKFEALSGELGLNQTWTDKDDNSYVFNIDTSKDRKETQGAKTEISQMYNLLTGYHTGTNSGAFLMLPRPHTIQSTPYRTFAQGIRDIEGIQDFFIVVRIPKHIDSICIRANLITGHFDENAEIIEPEEGIQEEKTLDFEYEEYFEESFFGYTKEFSKSFTIPESELNGWDFNWRKGKRAVTQVSLSPLKRGLLLEHNYGIEEPNTLRISGKYEMTGGGVSTFLRDNSATLEKKYTVHFEKKMMTGAGESADIKKLICIPRELSSCISLDNGCIETIGPLIPHPGPNINPFLDKIAGEYYLHTSNNKNKSSLMMFYSRIQSLLIRNSLEFHTLPKLSFIDTDYFKDKAKKYLSKEKLSQPVFEIKGLPMEFKNKFDKIFTVANLLELDLLGLRRKTGLSNDELINLRRTILGFPIEVVDSTE